MSSRQSRQRDVVLEVVRSTMDHPTADWVFRQARRRLRASASPPSTAT
jgi:Fe2+ or Zn2+ uptake regulation protein